MLVLRFSVAITAALINSFEKFVPFKLILSSTSEDCITLMRPGSFKFSQSKQLRQVKLGIEPKTSSVMLRKFSILKVLSSGSETILDKPAFVTSRQSTKM